MVCKGNFLITLQSFTLEQAAVVTFEYFQDLGKECEARRIVEEFLAALLSI